MMPDKLDELPPDFLYRALKALDIDYGEFMYHLFNDKPREVMIYDRIYMLYYENKEHTEINKN